MTPGTDTDIVRLQHHGLKMVDFEERQARKAMFWNDFELFGDDAFWKRRGFEDYVEPDPDPMRDMQIEALPTGPPGDDEEWARPDELEEKTFERNFEWVYYQRVLTDRLAQAMTGSPMEQRGILNITVIGKPLIFLPVQFPAYGSAIVIRLQHCELEALPKGIGLGLPNLQDCLDSLQL